MKKIFALVMLLAFSFTLTACSSSSVRPSKVLTIGILPDVDSIPLIIAKEKGCFEKQGVNVNIEGFKSAQERDSALLAGKIDGAVSDILAAAFAKEGNFEVIITSLTNGSYKLLVNRDSGIESFSDIIKKSVAVSKNTIIEYATDLMLRENGVNPGEIEKLPIPQITLRLEMLKNGKIQGATLPEPLASAAVKDGAKILSSTDILGINPGVLLFTNESIKSKSQEIEAFYRAYNEAVEYLQREDSASYMDTVIEKAGFPQEVKDIMDLPLYTKASLPSKEDFEKVIKWLEEKSLIKNSYDYEDLVSGKFVEQAQ